MYDDHSQTNVFCCNGIQHTNVPAAMVACSLLPFTCMLRQYVLGDGYLLWLP